MREAASEILMLARVERLSHTLFCWQSFAYQSRLRAFEHCLGKQGPRNIKLAPHRLEHKRIWTTASSTDHGSHRIRIGIIVWSVIHKALKDYDSWRCWKRESNTTIRTAETDAWLVACRVFAKCWMLSGANVMKMLVGDYEPPAERPGQNLILHISQLCGQWFWLL